MSEWISVKDRLPENYCYVLVSSVPVFGGIATVDKVFFCKDRSVALSNNPKFSRKRQGKETVYFEGLGPYSRATHWMPLPNPPEVE